MPLMVAERWGSGSPLRTLGSKRASRAAHARLPAGKAAVRQRQLRPAHQRLLSLTHGQTLCLP